MEKIDKKTKFQIAFYILIALVLITGVTYAFFRVNLTGDKEYSIQISGLTFRYTEESQGISLTNPEILTDEEGIAQAEYFDFNIYSDDTINYSIYLKEETGNNLNLNHVKVYLTGEYNNQIKEVRPIAISSLSSYSYDTNSYLLLNTAIKPDIETGNSTQNYKLRIWIDSLEAFGGVQYSTNDYSQSGQVPNSTFSFKVNVASNEASSQILQVPITTFKYLSNSYHEFIAPKNGYYKFELWGAEGGKANYNGTELLGGKGGYSTGMYYLHSGDIIYIYVGGKGSDSFANASTYTITDNGLGYNGGASANYSVNNSSYGGGGGATDIRCFSDNNRCISNATDLNWDSALGLNSRIIVAGGGGGASVHKAYQSYSGTGGSGGGFVGVSGILLNTGFGAKGTGGTQLSAGTCTKGDYACPAGIDLGGFGYGGGSTNIISNVLGGGGGGYYGGCYGYYAPGSGGSGYIANPNLSNKYMYTYCSDNCNEYKSTATDTYTDTTINASEIATSDYAKEGNGTAKITWIGESLQ